MRTNVFKTKNIGIQIGKPSPVLTDLEINQLRELKEQVFADIISRPKGTIKVEKNWIIDDSELNNIQRIDDSEIIKAFSFSNKKPLGKVKIYKPILNRKALGIDDSNIIKAFSFSNKKASVKVHKPKVTNKFSAQLPSKSKMA